MRLISRMMVGAVLVGGGIAVLITTAAWASTKPSAFDNQSTPMAATVRILAMSSSSRQSFAGNEEVYLADVSTKGSEHQFVRLIDQYPGFGLPIRVSLLKQQTVFQMKVTREPECDEPGANVYLRPGETNVYDGSVRDTLAAHKTDPIPCYKTIHQTIVTAKK